MIGAHDLGGKSGSGAVKVTTEHSEALFHANWERRAFALTLATGMLGRWNIDESRHARENQAVARYASNSYYETWLVGLQKLLVEKGLVTQSELAALPLAKTVEVEATAHSQPCETLSARTPAQAAVALRRGGPTLMQSQVTARFSMGERVRVLAMTQAGHTRAPQYTHNAVGVIAAINGVHVFPDANAHRKNGANTVGEPLYTVEFSSVALFGAASEVGDSVFVDLWEPYLSHA